MPPGSGARRSIPTYTAFTYTSSATSCWNSGDSEKPIIICPRVSAPLCSRVK